LDDQLLPKACSRLIDRGLVSWAVGLLVLVFNYTGWRAQKQPTALMHKV